MRPPSTYRKQDWEKKTTDKTAARFWSFMTEIKNCSPWTIAKALNALVPGMEWRGCTKKHMARSWARGDYHLDKVSLDEIRSAIKSVQDE